MMLAGLPVLRVGCVTCKVMPLSDCGVPSVTVAEPESSFGWRVTFAPAASWVVSGLRSHSAPGSCEVPFTTIKVAEEGAKFMVGPQACVVDTTILVGLVDESV